MFFYIQKLREKPYNTRRNIAIVTAWVLTSIISFVWVSTIDLSSYGGNKKKVYAGKAPSVYLEEGLANVYSGFTGAFGFYSDLAINSFKKFYQGENIVNIDTNSKQRDDLEDIYQRDTFENTKDNDVRVYDQSFDFIKNKVEWIKSDPIKYERNRNPSHL